MDEEDKHYPSSFVLNFIMIYLGICVLSTLNIIITIMDFLNIYVSMFFDNIFLAKQI